MTITVNKKHLSRLRVKIKSLACESRIIRTEKHKVKDNCPVSRGNRKMDLDIHRVTVVRPEARATQLAYAFVRGKPYYAVEQSCRTPVEIHKLQRILKSLTYNTVSAQEIQKWVDGVEAMAPEEQAVV